MKYLIESDRAMDYLKGQSDAIQVLQNLAPQGLALSLISYGEIYDGIYESTDPPRREREFRQFLRIAQVLPLTRRILQRFAKVRAQLRQKGTPLADMDLLIGVTALYHDLTLVTRNRRHFERIPNLKLL